MIALLSIIGVAILIKAIERFFARYLWEAQMRAQEEDYEEDEE